MQLIRILLLALAFWCLAPAGTGVAQDDDNALHFGLIEYELSCLPCHGLDGRGDGPLAGGLAVPPSDLTSIARSYGGVFPEDEVAAVIDGRALVERHGGREMPVWGDRYRVPVSSAENISEIDAEARLRIEALVEYLESIQQP